MVVSEDFNKAVDDLTTIDARLAIVENGVIESTPVAINTSATATVAQVASGWITSTSVGTVSITLPTATALATQLGAAAGDYFDFVVDNSAGANTITVIVGSGIVVTTPALTGGATLTISTANVIGQFRLFFTSATAAKLFRIA